ncbi:SPOR domain-containing protein [Psychromonas sp. KJ10-10]|uniref:SPOR domain-containing protein n=1 Tax=Psychromonas sp. KJ10-10 TaxID=3391823 RepID=UPI0039B4E876
MRFIPSIAVIASVGLLTFLLTQQIPTIEQYLQPSAEDEKQQEWARIINTANQQPSPKQQAPAVIETPISEEPVVEEPIIEELIISITPLETILAMPIKNYTLELADLKTEQAVKDYFIAHTGLQEKTFVYHKESSNYEKFVILLGEFESYKMAKATSKSLEEQFPDIDPWIKDYKMIQGDIK